MGSRQGQTGAPDQTVGATGYAGDIDPSDAWEILASEPDATLIDVRTVAEWNFVGLPDLDQLGKQVMAVEWQRFPEMERDPAFNETVSRILAERNVGPDAALILICRSGVRSRDAAISLTGHGQRRCYNLAGGFEGDLDQEGHRGRRNGWKVAGLPWRQR